MTATLTVDLDSFTGADAYGGTPAALTLVPMTAPFAAGGKTHVGVVQVVLDALGVGSTPLIAGVVYRTGLDGKTLYIGPLTDGTTVDLSDPSIISNTPPDLPGGSGPGGSLTPVTTNTTTPAGTLGALVGYLAQAAVTINGETVASGDWIVFAWNGSAWVTVATGTLGTPAPTDTTPPSAVTGLTVSSITDTTATVTWTASTDAESSVSYKWRAYPTGTTAPAYAATAALTVPLTGLLPGTDYTVEVYALSAGGPSASATSATFTTTVPVSPFLRMNYPDTSVTETGNATDGWSYSYSGAVNGVELLSHMGIPFGADGAIEVRVDGISTNDPAFAVGLSASPLGSGGGTNMLSVWKGASPNYRILEPAAHAAGTLVTVTSTAFANGDIMRIARVGGSTVFSVSKDNRETWIDLYTKVETFDASLHPSIRTYYGSVANYSSIRQSGMTEWGDLDGTLMPVRMSIPAGTTGIVESGSASAGWAYACDTTTGDPATSVSTYGNVAGSNTILATIEGITPGTPSAKVWFASTPTGSGGDRISLWVDAAGVLQWESGIYGSGSLAGQTFTDSVRLASVMISGGNKLAWSRDGIRWRTTAAFDGSWYATARSVLASAPSGKATIKARVAIRK